MIGATDGMPHAVTMTAELSQIFRTKREGVRFVLDAMESAFPSAAIHVYTVDGHFVAPPAARERPLWWPRPIGRRLPGPSPFITPTRCSSTLARRRPTSCRS